MSIPLVVHRWDTTNMMEKCALTIRWTRWNSVDGLKVEFSFIRQCEFSLKVNSKLE